MSETEGDFKEFNAYFPTDLCDAVRTAAKLNMRTISAEVSVAALRYIEAGSDNPPPTYETGDLKRLHIWVPNDIHAKVERIAVDRRWSANQVYMAAVARHIGEENT